MNLLTTLFILLIFAAAAFDVAQTLRADIPRKSRVVFVIIRIMIAALLLLVFLEPVLTLHRLPRRDRPLALLVDASSSMSLFSTDSTVNEIIHTLQKMGVSRKRKLSVLLFGDSLRLKKPDVPYEASDNKSLFPSKNDHPALRDAAGVLIISDGNWSNSSPVAEDFADKPVNYLSLNFTRHPASLTCNSPDTVTYAVGARCTVSIICSGYATVDAMVAVEAADGDAQVFSDSFHVAAGRFSHPVSLQFPAHAAGMHLFRITLTNNPEKITHRRYLLCRTVPSTFTYTIVTGSPSIDERFLRLALAGTPAFKETTKQNGLHEQIRFILHASPSELPPSPALPVFIGCLPTASMLTDTISGDRLFLPPETMSNPLDGVVLKDMPPITPLTSAHPPALSAVWLAGRPARGGTIPLLYSAQLHGRPFIACSFDGLWKWDFLPLSHQQGETYAQTFTRRLLSITRAALISVGSDTAIVWPLGQPSVFGALKLACITPPINPSSDATHRIACSMTGKNSPFRRDTTFSIIPNGPSIQYVTLPSPEPGDYSVSCTLSTSVRGYQSTVDFTVTADNAELHTDGQNTALLREIGQPIDAGDTARITALFDRSDGAAAGQPVEERYPFKRSWWILGALFALFGIEWMMRRRLHLD